MSKYSDVLVSYQPGQFGDWLRYFIAEHDGFEKFTGVSTKIMTMHLGALDFPFNVITLISHFKTDRAACDIDGFRNRITKLDGV